MNQDQDEKTVIEGSLEKQQSSSKWKYFWNKIRNFIINNKKKFLQILYTIIAVVIFLGGWEILCATNVLQEPKFFAPSRIFVEIGVLFKAGTIFSYILASLFRLLFTFILAAVFGTIIGLLMGSNKFANDFIQPIVTFFMPVPGIAWAPLFFVWIGFKSFFERWGWVEQGSWLRDFLRGNPILIPIGFIAAIFPIIHNVYVATQSVDQKLVWAAKTMGAGSGYIFRKVYLFNSMPFLFTGFKLGLARGWRTIIATEFLATAAMGLGYFIFDSAQQQTNLARLDIYAGLFVMAVVYYLIETTIGLAEKSTIEKWGMVRSGGSIE
ncbi:MAG: ABC transporter permease [Candidatus Heimdallarchaeota archaeon]